jgi:hypothetical protein
MNIRTGQKRRPIDGLGKGGGGGSGAEQAEQPKGM